MAGTTWWPDDGLSKGLIILFVLGCCIALIYLAELYYNSVIRERASACLRWIREKSNLDF